MKTGRPTKYTTEAERKAAQLEQARDAKRRRMELVRMLREDGPLCKSRLCLGQPVKDGYCASHANRAKVCRAEGCENIAMDGLDLCGVCDELAEDGPIKMKTRTRAFGRKQSPEEIAQRIESRKRNKAARIALIRGDAA